MWPEKKSLAPSRAALLPAWLIIGCILLAAAGCRSQAPFAMDVVEGSVRYDDESLIPSDSMIIRFEPLTPPVDAKTHPKAGMAKVDAKDGSFENVTTYKYGDGIVRGRHKVLLSARAEASGAKEVARKALIPPEYRDPATTPLEVDSRDSPFAFKIPKP